MRPQCKRMATPCSPRWIPLHKKAPRDRQVGKLMREHDKVVNEANRVAFADLEPPPLGP